MHVEPYIFYDGRCEEALNFYKSAIKAEVTALMRYSESPEAPPPGQPKPPADKVMHASFKIGDSTIMASDGFCTGKPIFNGFSLAISAKTEADAERTFAGLAAGGQVTQPLIKTFFSPKFGMLTDKFGVSWMVLVSV
jgi:PhnB protein